LVSKIETALPICTPIPVQWHPWSCPWASNPCSLDITTTTNVRDHDQVEVWLSPQSETNSSSSCARYPSIHAFSKSYFKHTIKKFIWEFVCVLYDFITFYRAQELCLHCLVVQCERKQAWTCQNAGEEDRTTLHYYLEGRNWWQLP